MGAALVGALLLAGCQLVVPPSEPTPTPEPLPSLEEGFTTPEERETAASLLRRAETAWAAGDAWEAWDAARIMVESYPRAEGSAVALRILAETSLELEDFGRAADAAARFARVFPPGSPEAAEGRLLEAAALSGDGNLPGAVVSLLEIPAAAPPRVLTEAWGRMGEWARSLSVDALEDIALSQEAAPAPAASPLLAEWASVLHYRGDEEGARRVALAILDAPARSPGAEEVARAIVDGRADAALGVAPSVGAIFSLESSPSVRPFAEAVQEGIRLAMERTGDVRRPVQLRSAEDAAVASRSSRAATTLEADGVLAVLGPLMDDGLAAAAASRRDGVLLISPTARVVPQGAQDVYSLANPDPTAGQVLARWALDNGIRSAAILYPQNPEGTLEAGAFGEAFRAGGGTVVFDRSFRPGTSFFEDPLREVGRSGADALVLPLSGQEVEVIAPQVTYYGLDTLGIQVLGTGGWAAEETLRGVDVRHTNGVVAVTSRPPGAVTERYSAFVRAYESFYQKTLRTPVAALGYDAAGLLLRALESGARTPAEAARALEGIRDFPGVTGDLSVQDGRIIRRYVPVRLQNRSVQLLGGP